VGGLLVRLFYGVGRASCGAARYLHSCRGCGLGRTNSFFGGYSLTIDRLDVFVSILVTGGVSVAVPVGPRVAGCLSGISVGRDWACSRRGSRIVVVGRQRHRWCTGG
jgi:hypothetical protein